LRNEADDKEDRSLDKRDFANHEILDDQARKEFAERLLEIEKDIAYRTEIGDKQTIEKLEKECATIQSSLGGSRDVRRRPRAFSGENEKARMSITHALKRAYESIGEQAPKAALHLQSSISTGSEFMYRDVSTSWKIRRTP
jgi:hypothetical protein